MTPRGCAGWAAIVAVVAGSLWGCRGRPAEEAVRICVPPGECPAIQDDDALIGDATAGAPLFARNCAICHGADGEGARPGAGDFRAATWQAGRSDAQLASAIRNGRGAKMPAFSLGERQIADLVAWIRARGAAPTPPPAKKGY